jgi:hypothetical protein
MVLEEFVEQNKAVLGATWFGPIPITPTIRLTGTTAALVWEASYHDASGDHVECWTSADAFTANCFRTAPAGTGGGVRRYSAADHRGG